MFITDVSAHHPFMSGLLGTGKDAWRAVGITTPNEWFYVSYAVFTQEGRFSETVMISCPYRLNFDQVYRLKFDQA
jgi:hypothetical protein